MRFSLVVTTGNARPWIEKCITSIAEQQTCWQWQCLVIDDASDDGTEAAIHNALNTIQEKEIHDRFQIQRNRHKKGALKNLVDGFNRLETAKKPMDVLIPIDGDDWLFSNTSLETVAKTYEATHCWLTHGGLITYPTGELCSNAVENDVIATGTQRQAPWVTSHLRSFRSHLWHSIRDEDLRDQTGAYYASAWDMAIMFPMLEMAAERIQCIHKALYVYNINNPESDHAIRRPEQVQAEQEIRSRKSYPRITQSNPHYSSINEQNALGFIVMSDNNPAQTIRLTQSLKTFYQDPRIHLIHNPYAGLLGSIPTDRRMSLENATQGFSRGQFSQVDAILSGLENALKNWTSTEWFALIDHESHPIISCSELLAILHASPYDGYLCSDKITPDNLHSPWHATCWQRFGGETGQHPFQTDFICYAGSPWMVLRRKALEDLLRFNKEESWLAEHYRRRAEAIKMPAPEESYIHTALCNQKHLNLRFESVCWEDWSQGWPRSLDTSDWPQLNASKQWFAGRFKDLRSSRLIDIIQDHWMQSAED